MKNKLKKMMALVAVLATFAIADLSSNIEAKEKIVVEVKNLYCKICAGGVRKKLQAVDDSVASVTQNFDGKTGKSVYTIKLKRGAALPDSMISRIVKGSGGDIRKIKRN